MDKDTHEKSIIRLRYHLEKDIKELYYLLRKKLPGEADDFGFDLDSPLVLTYQDDSFVGMCEQETEDGITSKVCAVTQDEDEINTFVDLEQLSVEDLNNLYIELCNMLNK